MPFGMNFSRASACSLPDWPGGGVAGTWDELPPPPESPQPDVKAGIPNRAKLIITRARPEIRDDRIWKTPDVVNSRTQHHAIIDRRGSECPTHDSARALSPEQSSGPNRVDDRTRTWHHTEKPADGDRNSGCARRIHLMDDPSRGWFGDRRGLGGHGAAVLRALGCNRQG